jgi:hypothetical protein
MLNSPLGGRRGIGFGLGRSWQRKSADWWLAGGIPATNCVAAYQAKGAESYAASLVNLANSGTYNLNDKGTHAPNWDGVNGWVFNAIDQYFFTGMTANLIESFAIRLTISSISLYSGIINSQETPTILEGRGYSSAYMFSSSRVLAAPLEGGVIIYDGYYLHINESQSANGGDNTNTGGVVIGSYLPTGTDNQHFGTIKCVSFYNINIASYVSDLRIAIQSL